MLLEGSFWQRPDIMRDKYIHVFLYSIAVLKISSETVEKVLRAHFCDFRI